MKSFLDKINWWISLSFFVAFVFNCSAQIKNTSVINKTENSTFVSPSIKETRIASNIKILPENEIINFKRIVASSGWNDEMLPVVNRTFKLNSTTNKVENVKLIDIQERIATAEEKSVLSGQRLVNDDFPNYRINYAIRNDRNEKYLIVSIVPLKKTGNQVTILEYFNIEFTEKNEPSLSQTKTTKATFANNSILRNGTGTWYKIAVEKTGIYKLDYSFFQSMGIDLTSVNPQQINIYGNGMGMLPEDNDEFRPDDLAKNNILVVGEGDGVFNSSDYVLFYAVGPDTWSLSGNSYLHKRHAYETKSYYYVNVQGASSAGRLTTASTTTSASTHNLTYADDYQFHDVDEHQLSKSGKVWVGEEFDVNLSHDISFSLKGINSSQPVDFRTSFVHNSKISGNSMNVTAGGNTVFNSSLGTMSGSYTVGVEVVEVSSLTGLNENVNLNLTFNRNSASDQAWLNYIEVVYKRNLNANVEDYFSFRDKASIGVGNVVQYNLSGMNNSKMIWEITDPRAAKIVGGNLSGSNFDFKIDADSLRTFLMVNTSGTFSNPEFIETVDNQDLHSLTYADLIIVTTEELITQAERLANLHRNNDGISVHVVDVEKVYNEFSSGMVDPTAIKFFMKMFYDRANGNVNLMPKNLCLFGDGSYDHKDRLDNNNDILPTYQSDKTFNLNTSFTSDDYFGLLDDNEGMSQYDLLDIGVGRMIVSTPQQATEMVDKVEHYMKNGSNLFAGQTNTSCSTGQTANTTFGTWRNFMTIIADDQNNNAFVTGAEKMRDTVRLYYPEIEQRTIYLDAYTQEVSTVGQRYPDAETAVDQRIDVGVNVINYVGHGGETGLSEERTINLEMINNWNNINKLPLFVSATCEFTRYDDPERVSAGEYVYLNPNGGAICLLTTTRLVYISFNEDLNIEFYRNVFDEENGQTLQFGEIYRRTKNGSITNDNFRNFTLIGDPALRIKLPQYDVEITTINGNDVNVTQDTIKALQEVTVEGKVIDENGNKISNFNGLVYPTIYDKKRQLTTLGQDIDSQPMSYLEWRSVVYRGKVSVNNGDFSFQFIVPKDIDLTNGIGRMSFYADNESIDAHGYTEDFYVGGIDTNAANDVTGPEVQIFLNDYSFVDGGITDEQPTLLVKLFDEHGINTVGNGIGHDLTAVIDQNTSQPIILNDFYEADTNSYKSGVVNYPLNEMDEGIHTLTVKVWDVYNNSTEETIQFIVANQEELALDHVLNYPNPFTTRTEFYFEHNQSCEFLDAQIQIFTVSGKLVKTIQRKVETSGFRSDGIEWDGRDDFGDKIGRGVYVYRLAVTTPDGETVDKFEKLVILN